MRYGEPNQYTGLCNIYNGFDQVQRGRLMTAYFVLNAGALPVIFVSAQPDPLKLVLSFTIMAVHVAWIAATHRSHNMLRTLGERLGELERQDEGTKNATRVKFFDDVAVTYRRVGPLARLGRMSPFVAGLAVWLGLVIWYVKRVAC